MRSRRQQTQFLVKALPGLQMAAFLLCPHMVFPLCVCARRKRSLSIPLIMVSYPRGLGTHPYDLI